MLPLALPPSATTAKLDNFNSHWYLSQETKHTKMAKPPFGCSMLIGSSRRPRVAFDSNAACVARLICLAAQIALVLGGSMNQSSVCIAILLTGSIAGPAFSAEFPPKVSSQDIPKLLQATAFVRGLEEDALIRLVPEQSGLYYVGCPNCNGGRQENQLDWTPGRPDEVACRFCNHRYPSEQYPMRNAVTVRNPRGRNGEMSPRRYPQTREARNCW